MDIAVNPASNSMVDSSSIDMLYWRNAGNEGGSPPPEVFQESILPPFSVRARSCEPKIVMNDRAVPSGFFTRKTYIVVELRILIQHSG